MSDADWALILKSGHWDCGGWSIDGGGALVCACKSVIRKPKRTVTIAVTQKHIRNAKTYAEGGLNAKDPVELAVLDAIPEAVAAQDWYMDAEVREMCITVWLDTERDVRFTLAFTFPPEAFDFIDDFVDGKPVSPFTVTAEATA